MSRWAVSSGRQTGDRVSGDGARLVGRKPARGRLQPVQGDSTVVLFRSDCGAVFIALRRRGQSTTRCLDLHLVNSRCDANRISRHHKTFAPHSNGGWFALSRKPLSGRHTLPSCSRIQSRVPFSCRTDSMGVSRKLRKENAPQVEPQERRRVPTKAASSTSATRADTTT
jgi:hypothetical protein